MPEEIAGPYAVVRNAEGVRWSHDGGGLPLPGGWIGRYGAREVVVGLLDDRELVVIESELAHVLATTWTALNESETIMELLLHLPEPYSSYVSDLRDAEPNLDIESVRWSAIVGNWLEWPAQQMLALLPAEIQSEFGTLAFSASSGPALQLDADRSDELVEALERWGYIVQRDDGLVTRACGHG